MRPLEPNSSSGASGAAAGGMKFPWFLKGMLEHQEGCATPLCDPLSAECWGLLCFPRFPGEHCKDHTVVSFGGVFLHFQFPGCSGTWKEVRADRLFPPVQFPGFAHKWEKVRAGQAVPGFQQHSLLHQDST